MSFYDTKNNVAMRFYKSRGKSLTPRIPKEKARGGRGQGKEVQNF